MSTYAETQRRQTIRVLAGAAFAATLLLLAPLRVSYGEHSYCAAQKLPAPAQGSRYLPNVPAPISSGIWYGPTGARYGYATAEHTPIYPTIQTAERCS